MDHHEWPNVDHGAGVLPWSIESESGVLGALLLNNDAWEAVGSIVTEADFYRHEHRLIFGAVAALVSGNKPADVVTVYERLKSQGKDCSMSYLNDLAQYVPSAANIRQYAETVAERSLMRRLVAAADKAREIAVGTGFTLAQRLDRCQNEFQQLSTQRTTKEPKPVADLVVNLVDRLTELAEGRKQSGIRTRIPTLDHLLGGGFKPGKQIVLAARPSVGKTALAMEFAYAAASQGYTAGFLSQEMEDFELADRLTARIGAVQLDNINTGKLSDSEWTSITDVMEQFRNLPLYIDDQPGLSLSDIQAKARKLKREHGIKVLVIDYLQLCAPTDSKASRHHQIEEISRGLKVLAKQLGLTTVVLSQLNREVEKRTGGRPMLADLKESGALEEDADTVILLSCDGTRENGDVLVHAELAKNRGGKRGFVKLAFTGKYQRFAETVVDASEQPKKLTRRAYTEDV